MNKYQDSVDLIGAAPLRTRKWGEFIVHVASVTDDDAEHMVLTKGTVRDQENVLVRVSSECVPGMVFGDLDCDCRPQLDFSMELIAAERTGVLIFLRQEGRGHGLAEKIRAKNHKESGLDTFTAVEALGLPADRRDYNVAARILIEIGVGSVRLVTGNPAKVDQISSGGIRVDSVVPTPMFVTKQNKRHLEAKVERGFQFDGVLNAVDS